MALRSEKEKIRSTNIEIRNNIEKEKFKTNKKEIEERWIFDISDERK